MLIVKMFEVRVTVTVTVELLRIVRYRSPFSYHSSYRLCSMCALNYLHGTISIFISVIFINHVRCCHICILQTFAIHFVVFPDLVIHVFFTQAIMGDPWRYAFQSVECSCRTVQFSYRLCKPFWKSDVKWPVTFTLTILHSNISSFVVYFHFNVSLVSKIFARFPVDNNPSSIFSRWFFTRETPLLVGVIVT